MFSAPHRPLATGFALLLLVAACGSDGTESTGSTDSAATAVSEAADGSTGTAEAEADTTSGAAVDSLPPTPVEDLVASFGAEPTPELLGCLEDRGVGAEVAADSDPSQLAAGLMGCAPDEMGTIMAEGLTVPGVGPDQVQCVMTAVATAVGALNAEEAAVALGSEDIPDDIRAVVSDEAPSACSLTAEQVDTVLSG